MSCEARVLCAEAGVGTAPTERHLEGVRPVTHTLCVCSHCTPIASLEAGPPTCLGEEAEVTLPCLSAHPERVQQETPIQGHYLLF